MAYLSKEDQEYLKEIFNGLDRSVRLIYFTSQVGCDYCDATRELLSELANLSDNVVLEINDITEKRSKAEQYGIDLVPGLVVANDKDYGIRYFGVPGGHEFSSLIAAMLDVSKGSTGLSAETKSALEKLEEPVHIKVFITLMCPHCPRAVRIAHQLAMESELIRGDMIEAQEFPQLVNQYDVGAVPKVVVNDAVEFEGALPEAAYLEQVLRAEREARSLR